MDDSVIRAMARWPDVPGVFGYLALNTRGQWLLQGHGLEHEKTIAFINRNYSHDDDGRWFFQNGPQRAYVELAYTPWVYRLLNGKAVTHTGLSGTVSAAWLDEEGRLLLFTEHGVGLLHDQDLAEAVERLTDAGGASLDEDTALNRLEDVRSGTEEAGLCMDLGAGPVPIAPIRSEAVARRFRFQPVPAPREDEAGRTHMAAD